VKRRELIRALEALGCTLEGEGGEHTLYRTRSGRKIAVPRHTEVSEGVSRDLLKKARGLRTPT
jgi:predicted RNA binding protein YcfA (HicA-like mRNA interferase family)